jgi:4-amino-4-deoxy-L-arabinose transferase-like glycosyltransferase
MTASDFERIGERLARSPLGSLAAILIVALACFLPGFNTIAPLDGDEPGYAVAAREMVATRDYAAVRVQTQDAEWRPRGAYWIQAFVVDFTSVDVPIWAYRLPSLIAAVAAAMLTWWTAMAFGPPRAALLSGLFVATSGIVGLEARLATPDAMLLAATTLAGGALVRVWLRRDGKRDDLAAGLFWTGLALGILAKGIVAPAIAAAAVAILAVERGEYRWLMLLRPAQGIAWLFFIISPWLIAVALTFLQGASEGPSADFLAQIGAPFEIEAPPGSYALILPLLAGPAVTFIFLAFPWIFSELRRPVVLFAFAWGGPLWLAAELISAKQPQAILPAIPAIALIAGAAVDAGVTRIRGGLSWFYSLGPAVWPPFIALVVPAVFFYFEGRFPWGAFVAFAVAAVLGPITWVWLRNGQPIAAALMSVIAVIFIYVGFFGVFVPGLSGIRIGERVAALAKDVALCPAPVFAGAGFPEESLVLALGPDTRIVDPWSAADFLNSAGCRIAVVDTSQISSFRQRAEDLGLGLLDRGRVTGFNLRKMRAVDLHLFTAGGPAQ